MVIEKPVDRSDLIIRNAQFLALLELHHPELAPPKPKPVVRAEPSIPTRVTDPELLEMFYRRIKLALQYTDDEGETISAHPSVSMIVAEVARFYTLSVDEMLSNRRANRIVLPRQIAMYLAKSLTLHSFPVIGRHIGGRDHTTILHAVRKIEAMIAVDETVRDEIEILKMRITERLNQSQEVKVA